jgi:hypothetical protein
LRDVPRVAAEKERSANSRRRHAERPVKEPVAAQPESAPAPGPAPSRFADPSPRRDTGRPRREDEPVIGLGDHVPSFLLRPVPKRVRHPHDHERIEAEE